MAEVRRLENRYKVISVQINISAVDVPIWTNFGSRMQNETPLTEKIVGIETGSRIPTGWTFVFPKRK